MAKNTRASDGNSTTDDSRENGNDSSVSASTSPSKKRKTHHDHHHDTSSNLQHSPPSDQTTLTRQDKAKAKKRRKQDQRALHNPPSFSFDTRGFRNGRFIQVKDVRDFALHLLCDEKAQQWLYVANKRNVKKLVVVMAPGVTATTLGVTQPPLSANLPFPLIPSTTDNDNDNNNNQASTSKLPIFQKLFSHACPTKAPGDRYKLHSAYQSFINCPLTGAEKERRERARKEQGQLAKTNDPSVYLLTREQMLEQAYPEPTRKSTDQKVDKNEFKNWKTSDGWIEAPFEKFDETKNRLRKVLGLDCEMCLTEDGSELARLSIVDQKGERIYDSLVKPQKPITDYLTRYSGLTKDKLDSVTKTLEDVQRDLIKIIDYNTILIGHSLECDLRVLKLVHSFIIDTSVIYQHPRGPPFKASLKWLAQKWLKKQIQNGLEGNNNEIGHDSEQDARTCIELLNLKMTKGPGFGEFTNDQETIFERISRGTDSKRSVVVDHGTPAQWHGAKASSAIGCNNDDEVLEGVLSSLEDHQLVFARFMGLSNTLGWTGNARVTADTAASLPAVDPIVETDDVMTSTTREHDHDDASDSVTSQQVAYERFNSQLTKLHQALPPLTALILFTGHGNPLPMNALNSKKLKFEKLFKMVKQSEIQRQDLWMEQDDRQLQQEVEKVRYGLSFYCVKTEE
ncbi:hypothetical protein OIO90_005946 [Microbotryomycetes sp. JL221]|nr:hypothetical protein OIO90_005946 [Microbotryomycetes sp. JL221]